MSTSSPTFAPTTAAPTTCDEWGVKVNCPDGKLTCSGTSYKCACDTQDCYYINGVSSCNTCNDVTNPPVPTVGPATMPPEYNTILTSWGLGGICASGIVFITVIILIIIFFIMSKNEKA